MARTVRSVLMATAGATMLLLTQPASARNMNVDTNNTMPPSLIAFGKMYGVDGPFVGDANPIRNVVGDELPWEVASARGRLDTTGHLRIRVRGLVFTHDDVVPPDLQGRNDEETFRALVSCLSEDESETAVTTENVMTEGFPATPSGDSNIDAMVTLPNPCVAPIVFVLSGSEDKWFAVIGFESEGETHHPPHHPPHQSTTTTTTTTMPDNSPGGTMPPNTPPGGSFPDTFPPPSTFPPPTTFPPTPDTFPPPATFPPPDPFPLPDPFDNGMTVPRR